MLLPINICGKAPEFAFVTLRVASVSRMPDFIGKSRYVICCGQTELFIYVPQILKPI